MFKRRAAAIGLVVLLSSAIAACGSGGSSNDTRQRNAALPTTTALLSPDMVYVSNNDGTAFGCNLNSSGGFILRDSSCRSVDLLRETQAIQSKDFARYDLTPAPIDPVASVWQEIERVQRLAGFAPVIARLPVAFSPAQVGIAARNGMKTSDSAWGTNSSIKHMSSDAGIAAATIALNNRLQQLPGYKSRTVDLQATYGVLADKTSTKLVSSGKSVSASSAFAQLGVVPFALMFVTSAETKQLLSEQVIAGAFVDSVSSVADDESSGMIGVRGWTTDDINGTWMPAIANAPTGKNTVIVIDDSGVLSSHPALQNKVIREGCVSVADPACANAPRFGTNLGQPSPGGLAQDHGTHVAGIAAARKTTLSDGSVVPPGVAPDAQIISYRNCWNGRGGCSDAGLINATGDAVNQIANGTNIVSYNSSYGPITNNTPVQTAITALASADVVISHANGNGGSTSFCDGDFTGLYQVANLQKDWTPNPSTDFLNGCTDLWAPGTSIVSAGFTSSGNVLTPAQVTKTGTSMAAPHVAGAAALVAQALRVATPAGEAPASLTANFPAYAGISAPVRAVQDSRATCESAAQGSFSCTGSGGRIPVLNLKGLVDLMFPNGGKPTFISAQEMAARADLDYARQVASQSPTTWTVNSAAALSFKVSRRSYFYLDDSRRASDVSSHGFEMSRDPSAPAIKNVYSSRVRYFVVVENGTLSKLNMTKTFADGTTQVSDAAVGSTLISRGPMACRRSGWLELWSIDPSVASMPSGGSVQLNAVLSGPSSLSRAPRGLIVLVRFQDEPVNQAPKLTFNIDLNPVSVSAPDVRGPVPARDIPTGAPARDANWSLTYPSAPQYLVDLLVHSNDDSYTASTSTDNIPLVGDWRTHYGFAAVGDVRHPRLRFKRKQDLWKPDGSPISPRVGFVSGTTSRQTCYTVLMTASEYTDAGQNTPTTTTTVP